MQAIAARWLMVLCLLLSACGGGGGGGNDGGTAGPTVPMEPPVLSGTLRWISAAGWADPAPPGQPVQLVSIDAVGSRTEVLATTQTGNGGRYEFKWPADRAPSDRLTVESIESDGAAVRALAMGNRVDVGAASELVTRVYLEALRSAGRDTAESIDRLHRWQTATTTFLTLTPSASAGDTPARLDTLRRWLDADPPSRAALASLRQEARLPPSLADIGGLLGVGLSAWEADDSARGRHQVRVLPAVAEGADFGTYLFPAETSGTVQSRPAPSNLLRFNADRVDEPRVVLPIDVSPQEQLLRTLIGPVTFAAIGGAIGETQELMNRTITIVGATATSALPNGTTIVVESTQTAEGMESIQAFGQELRALRTTWRERLILATPDGERVESTALRTDWNVPFAGAVRSTYSSTASVAGSAPVTLSGERSLLRGVSNEVSWPGRVRLSARAFDVPAAPRTWWPFGLSAERSMIWGTQWVDSIQLSALVTDIDSGARKALRAFDSPAEVRDGFVRLSPDGSKLYTVQSVASPLAGAEPIPLAAADAAGALIERFDATTLVREMSMRLPALRSLARPVFGLPRNEVGWMLVSPVDAKTFVATGPGAVLVRDSVAAPQELFDRSAEWASGVVIGGAVFLRSWDGVTNELHANVAGLIGDPVPLAVPVQPDGIPLDGARPGFSPAIALGGGIFDQPGEGSLFTDELLYHDAFGAVFDRASGALLGRGPFGGSVLGGSRIDESRCALVEGAPICLEVPGLEVRLRLHRLAPRTLEIVESVDLQANLRWATAQRTPTLVTMLAHAGRGELVAAAPASGGSTAFLFSVSR